MSRHRNLVARVADLLAHDSTRAAELRRAIADGDPAPLDELAARLVAFVVEASRVAEGDAGASAADPVPEVER